MAGISSYDNHTGSAVASQGASMLNSMASTLGSMTKKTETTTTTSQDSNLFADLLPVVGMAVGAGLGFAGIGGLTALTGTALGGTIGGGLGSALGGTNAAGIGAMGASVAENVSNIQANNAKVAEANKSLATLGGNAGTVAQSTATPSVTSQNAAGGVGTGNTTQSSRYTVDALGKPLNASTITAR